MDFGDVGVICLNRDVEKACENCPWWEWDSGKQQCLNCQLAICPIYRERLFGSSAAFSPHPKLPV